MKVEYLFDIYVKWYMLTHRLEAYIRFFFMSLSLVRCHGVQWVAVFAMLLFSIFIYVKSRNLKVTRNVKLELGELYYK